MSAILKLELGLIGEVTMAQKDSLIMKDSHDILTVWDHFLLNFFLFNNYVIMRFFFLVKFVIFSTVVTIILITSAKKITFYATNCWR